jgi:hypothetical protein
MDLKEFVEQALCDIVADVAAAREPARELRAYIGSDVVDSFAPDADIMRDAKGRIVSLVEFDVALAQTTGAKTKGGIGVFLAGMGAGTQAALQDETSNKSRIKFSVPVVFTGKRRAAAEGKTRAPGT